MNRTMKSASIAECFAAYIAASIIVALTIAPTCALAGTITLPAGTTLHVILETTLTTKGAKVGDSFRARMVMPVFLNQREVLPMGTSVEGTIVGLQGPGRLKGKAEMQLRPDKLLLPDGRDISLAASLESAKGADDVKVDSKEGTVKSSGGKNDVSARTVGGGVGLGAGIGAVAGGGMGAAVGAGAAGTVFLLHHLFKKGKDAVLPAGSELTLEVTRPFSFSDMQEVRPTGPAEKKVE